MTADPIGKRLAELAGRIADGDIRFVTAELRDAVERLQTDN